MIRIALVLVCLVAPAYADPEIVTLDAQPTIVREVKTKPEALGSAITGAVLQLVSAADQMQIAGPPFARYIARGKQLRVEVGLPVRKAPSKRIAKDIRASELPAGRAAILVVKGPHEDLPKAHATLAAWIRAQGETPAGADWEVYVTNPITTPDPKAQETKIVVPLAPKR